MFEKRVKCQPIVVSLLQMDYICFSKTKLFPKTLKYLQVSNTIEHKTLQNKVPTRQCVLYMKRSSCFEANIS